MLFAFIANLATVTQHLGLELDSTELRWRFEHGDGSKVAFLSEEICEISADLPSQFQRNFAVAKGCKFYKLRAAEVLEFLGMLPFAIHWNRSDWRSASMQPNSQERRAMRRFDMRLPAIVRMEGRAEYHTETQNVSARGVFFYLDHPVSAGTKLEVTLTFPPHVTLTDAVRVRFGARVIRVEHPLPTARTGVAAMIEEYEFLGSGESAPDFISALQTELKSTTH